MERDSDKEFLVHEQKTVMKIKEATDKWINMAQEPCSEEPITVEVTSPSQLEDLCKKSCIVRCQFADPSKCAVSTKNPREAETEKPYTFTVHLADYQGKQCTEKQTVQVTAELRRLRDGCVTPAEVMAKTANDYTVSIQPGTRGRHELIVKVNGTHISNSPFPVFVKKPLKQLHAPEKKILGLHTPCSMKCHDGKMYICEHEEDGAVAIFDLKFNRIASIEGLTQLKLLSIINTIYM